MHLTDSGWVLEPRLCLRWRCWEMPQEQWDRKYNQGNGISAFRKSWWFGRSNSELCLSDLIFSALDPLHFLKVRSCDGVLSQLPEITKQEALPGGEEARGLSSQTLVCHTDTQPILTSLGKGSPNPSCSPKPSWWRHPCIWMPAHFSSPWTARFQHPSQGRELLTQLCNLNRRFCLLSPLSVNPPDTWCTPGFQTCRSRASVSFLMQYFLQGRQKLLTIVLPLVLYFGLKKLIKCKMRNWGWQWCAFMRWRALYHLETPNGQFCALLCHAANSQQNFATVP